MKNSLFIIIFLFSQQLLTAQCFTPDPSIWENTWTSCATTPNPKSSYGNTHWIRYDLGLQRKLSKTWVWNTNDPSKLNQGFHQVKVDYSVNGTDWSYWGEMNFPQAAGDAVYGGFSGPDLSNIEARYVLLTAVSNHGNPSCAGIAEMKFNLSTAASPAPPACAAPNNLVIEELFEDEVFVTWANIAASYIMYFREQGETDWWSYTDTEAEFYADELTPNTTYELQIGVNCGDEIVRSNITTFTTPSGGVLAIDDFTFIGETRDEQHYLCWKGEFEGPLESYEIQHSTNGIDFEILEVADARKSGKRQTFINETPVEGDNYYRLKMLFDNGAYKFSHVVRLDFEETFFEIFLYENPIIEDLEFSIESSFSDIANISLLTTNGQAIYRVSRTLERGENEFYISVDGLPNGVYFLDILTLNKRKRIGTQVVKVE